MVGTSDCVADLVANRFHDDDDAQTSDVDDAYRLVDSILDDDDAHTSDVDDAYRLVDSILDDDDDDDAKTDDDDDETHHYDDDDDDDAETHHYDDDDDAETHHYDDDDDSANVDNQTCDRVRTGPVPCADHPRTAAHRRRHWRRSRSLAFHCN